jgi:hypothetical protein
VNPVEALRLYPLRTERPPAWLAPWLDDDLQYGLAEPVVTIGPSSDPILEHADALAALALGLAGSASTWYVVQSDWTQSRDEIPIRAVPADGLTTLVARACRQPEQLVVLGCRPTSPPPTSVDQARPSAELVLLIPTGGSNAIIGAPDLMREAGHLGAHMGVDAVDPPSTVRLPRTQRHRPRGAVAVVGLAALIAFAVLAGHGSKPQPGAPITSRGAGPSGPGLLLPADTRFPGGRVGAGVSFDALTGAVTLFGGGRLDASSATELFPRDTWAWDVNGWRRVPTTTAPPGVSDAAFAYDQRTGSAILFGGSNGRGRTWQWNGLSWSRLHPRSPPPPDAFASAVYDPRRRAIVLTTVCCETALARSKAPLQAWQWRHDDWSLLRTRYAPRLARAPLTTYDLTRGELLLLTQGSTPVSNTTDQVTATSSLWALKDLEWRRLSTPRSPPYDPLRDRFGYDPASRRDVLFQGGDLPTWTWDGSTWHQLAAGGPLYSGAITANATVGRLLLFGGQVPADDLSSVWTFQHSRWQRLMGR